jgi:hypothetical protein
MSTLENAINDNKRIELKVLIDGAKWEINYHMDHAEKARIKLEAYQARLKRLEEDNV